MGNFAAKRPCWNSDLALANLMLEMRNYLNVARGLGRLQRFVLANVQSLSLFHIFAEDRVDRAEAYFRHNDFKSVFQVHSVQAAISALCIARRFGILKWLLRRPRVSWVTDEGISTQTIAYIAIDLGQIDRFTAKRQSEPFLSMLRWIVKHFPWNVRYSKSALDDASSYGWTEAVKWWIHESKLPLKYSEQALDRAVENDHTAVMDVWFESSLPLKYTSHAVINAHKDYARHSQHGYRTSGP
ncbi:hypothetical protein H9P43_006105 [Blastocladiella emersonii ATCC 22665]|nr:hypothetical protein H9P43_006105 [Blastocladiella emersonii ATCC 22665]